MHIVHRAGTSRTRRRRAHEESSSPWCRRCALRSTSARSSTTGNDVASASNRSQSTVRHVSRSHHSGCTPPATMLERSTARNQRDTFPQAGRSRAATRPFSADATTVNERQWREVRPAVGTLPHAGHLPHRRHAGAAGCRSAHLPVHVDEQVGRARWSRAPDEPAAPRTTAAQVGRLGQCMEDTTDERPGVVCPPHHDLPTRTDELFYMGDAGMASRRR